MKYEQAEEHAEKEDASDTTSSAESSSSHSSSTSAKKKKTQHREVSKKKRYSKTQMTLKEAKAKTRAKEANKKAQVESKALEKVYKSRQALAQQVASKIAGPLLSLTSVIARPLSLNVPQMVMNSARKSLVELQDLEKESMLVIGDPTKEFSIQNIKTVSIMITSSKKTELLMTQLMNSLSNFSG